MRIVSCINKRDRLVVCNSLKCNNCNDTKRIFKILELDEYMMALRWSMHTFRPVEEFFQEEIKEIKDNEL